MLLNLEYKKLDFSLFQITIESGYPGSKKSCNLTIAIFHKYFCLYLPQWILQPHIMQIESKDGMLREVIGEREEGVIKIAMNRIYGFAFEDGYLCMNYGAKTYNSATEKSFYWRMPWEN